MNTLSVSYLLSQKYVDGMNYSGLAYTGLNVSNILWPFLSIFIMNPRNIPMNIEVISDDGTVEYFFDKSVSDQYPAFCWYYGLTSFAFMVLPTMALKEPNHLRPNLVQWLRSIF